MPCHFFLRYGYMEKCEHCHKSLRPLKIDWRGRLLHAKCYKDVIFKMNETHNEHQRSHLESNSQ